MIESRNCQTTGKAQNNNLTPSFLQVCLRSSRQNTGAKHMVTVFLYGGDLFGCGSVCLHVQQALAGLHFTVSKWTLTINLTKIEATKFRQTKRGAARNAPRVPS